MNTIDSLCVLMIALSIMASSLLVGSAGTQPTSPVTPPSSAATPQRPSAESDTPRVAPSVEIPAKPTTTAIELLKKREGSREMVEAENGKLIAGWGHVLSSKEREEYTEGDIVLLPQREAWLKADSMRAWNAAKKQAIEIGDERLLLVEALFAVNYQFNASWNDKHKKTWQYLLNKDWKGASKEAEDSKWYKQTPRRVQDFQTALDQL